MYFYAMTQKVKNLQVIINDCYEIIDFQPITEEIAEILIEKGYPKIRNLKYLKL